MTQPATQSGSPSKPDLLPPTFNRLAWSNLAAQSAEQIALAAAPTNFDALVSGAVYDPYSTYNGNDSNFHIGSIQTNQKPPVNPHNNLPTAECFYPGGVAKTVGWRRISRRSFSPSG